jgi:hypothetical protein
MVECPRCHKIYKKEGKCWNDHVLRGCDVRPQKEKAPAVAVVALENTTDSKRRRSPRLAVEELRQNQEQLWNLFTRQDNLLHELETMFPSF